jgi:hypothetical protein
VHEEIVDQHDGLALRSQGGQQTFRQQTIEHADYQADKGQADKRWLSLISVSLASALLIDHRRNCGWYKTETDIPDICRAVRDHGIDWDVPVL